MPKRKIQETSLEAYKSLDASQIREIYSKILWALDQIGEGTFEDLAVALRIPKERIWKRLSEMARLEMIYRPGTKKMLSSGRNGYTWKRISGTTPPEKVTESSLKGDSVADISRKISKLSQQSLF